MSEKTRVLLIEGNLGDARLIRKTLTDATQADPDAPDFDVVRTAKLSTGLKRLAKGDIDVVLLDLSLPDSQGLDTFAKIHTQAPEVPVVILSDPEDKALAIEAVRKGAQDHLFKGQTSSALLVRSIHCAVKYARVETIRQRTEETLRASEQRFRLLYENTPLAYHSLDKDGRLIEVNQAWLDMLGYSRDQVIGRWFGDFLSPQHTDNFRQSFPRFIATGTTHAEFEMVRKDGSPIIASIDGRIGCDAQGDFRQTHCIIHDVTERKQAEEALHESEERYRTLFNRVPVGLCRSTPAGEILEASPAVVRILGYPDKESLLATSAVDLYVDAEERTRFRKLVEREGTVHNFETQMLRHDGTTVWIRLASQAVQDTDGQTLYEGTIEDITDRKQAEEALRKSEERHRLISELTTDYIFRLDIDADGNAVMSLVSENFFAATGRTLEEAKTPDLWTTIFHPDDLGRAMELFQAVVSSGQPGEIECRTYVKSGKQRWVQILAQPMWDEEKQRTVAILGAVKDITERKQVQEALQHRVEFEGLITDISTHFIKIALDEVDSGISRALKTIGEFTDVDRSYVLLFDDYGTTMDNTHEWCAEGIEPQAQRIKGIPTDAFKWSLERIRRSEVVHIPRVADLPPEASAEREEFQAEGIQSLIMVPIVYGRNALGFLGLDSVRAERAWGEDTIALLRIVGETFANALERKKAEEALRESKERYHQLFELESDALFLIDNASGRILEANAAASALYGYSHEELLAKRNTDLSAEPEDTKKVTRTTPITNQVVTVPLRFHRKRGGTVFPVEITGRFFDKQGQSVHIAAIRDITDRKRAEEQIEHLNRLQGDLLSPRSLTEKLDLITESVVSIFDADFARIWITQAGDLCESGCVHAQVTEGPYVCHHRDRCLHLLSSSGRYTHLDGEMHRRVPFGCHKIGRVAAGEDPKFITNDVVHDPRVHDHEWARKLGLASFAGYRLKSTSGEIMGVLALFSKHVISPNEDALLESLANTTAQVIQTTQAEEALERSEATLRSIFRAAPVGIGLVTDRMLQWTNDALSRMVGYTAEELKDQSARMLYPSQEEFERVGREKYAEIVGQGTGSIETRFLRKDGEIIDVLLSSTPIDPTDLSVGVTFTALDITKRKKAEEALRESEHMLAEAQKVAHLGWWEWNINSDVVRWSEEERRIFGLSPQGPDQTLGDVLTFVHPGDLEKTRENIRKGLAGEAPYEFETRIVRPDGSIRHIDTRAQVYRDDQGEPIRVMGTTMDITERKQAEEEKEHLLAQIQEQAQRVQQIIDTVPEGVILLDASAGIVLANPLGRKELTALTDTLVGGTLTRLGDRPLTEILTSPPGGLWHEIAAEGRDFRIVAQPVSEATETSPTPGGWVLVIRDVTQQREIERRIQQQERLAAVGQLAAGIAHDFNNIMAVITLYAGMSLRTPDVPENVCERLGTINQQAQRASDLIQQIMDFSRRAVLERGPMDLLVFIKEQVKLLQRTLPESIEIDLSYGKDEYTIRADPTRIQQVLMNLATNARDAMPQGGNLHIILERIRLEEGERPPIPEMETGEWVCVQVIDTGSGIPDDILPHIFNPFFTTKEPGKGTGLGLAQVYGIVRQHEGYINVRTQAEKGTTFILYLPALSAAGEPETPTAEKEQLPQGKGQTILVVEDEATTRAAVVGSLELLGYQALEAANGKEALLIFEQHADQADQLDRIALILSDVVMPEMGGQALFHALKQQEPNVKVLLLTGHPLEEQVLETLRVQGLGGWLPKPPSLEQLAEVVAQVLEE
ncbi:MAG: PAS domain S-box protein [Anaerolineae bacterium]|nr:PAS domain S-box protein [Anaerolineae bacterium]